MQRAHEASEVRLLELAVLRKVLRDRAVLVELGHLELQEVDRFVPNGKIMQQPAWTYKRQQQHIKYG